MQTVLEAIPGGQVSHRRCELNFSLFGNVSIFRGSRRSSVRFFYQLGAQNSSTAANTKDAPAADRHARVVATQTRVVARSERYSDTQGGSEHRTPARPRYIEADNSNSNSSRAHNTEGTIRRTTGVAEAADRFTATRSGCIPQHDPRWKDATKPQQQQQQQQRESKPPESHDQQQQQQQRHHQRRQHLPPAPYMQQLSQYPNWQDMQDFPLDRKLEYFRAAAIAAARAVRQHALAAAADDESQLQKLKRQGPVYYLYRSEHRSGSSGSSSSSGQDRRRQQQRQQQQEGEARSLFRWYLFRVLRTALRILAPHLRTTVNAAAVGGTQDTAAAAAAAEVLITAAHQPRIDPIPQQQQQQQQQCLDHHFEPLTAAVLLQSAAAMGWNAGNVGYITGGGREDLQLMTVITSSVLEAGLRSAQTQQQQQQRNQISSSSSQQDELSCHSAVIVNLVTAGLQLGINLKDQPVLLLLLQKVLAAALSSSSRVGYPFCVKLLRAWVFWGAAMPPMVMEPLVACFKVHLLQHPRLLLPLLLRLRSMEQSKPWPAGKQLLSRFREMLYNSDITDCVTHLHSQIQQDLSSSSSSSRVETLLEVTAALTQLPKRARTDLDRDLEVILIRSGVDHLIKATEKIQGCDWEGSGDLRSGSSSSTVQQQQQQIMRSGFTPVQISKWLSDLSKVVGSDLAVEDLRDLEVALLNHLGATSACHGIWPPSVFLPLAAAAAALGLPAAAAAEWWAAVQDIVLLEIKQYNALQALNVLQLLAQGKFRPEVDFLDRTLLPAAAQGFCTAAAAAAAGSSSNKKVKKLTIRQLLELLDCLVELHIKPNKKWWLSYQESLLLQCRSLPQQQQQQQQQSCLTAPQIIKLISAGRARLHLKPDLLHFVLQQLDLTQSNELTDLTPDQCVDLFVGLSKVIPKSPEVLDLVLYRRLCKILAGKWFPARDIANIIRSMGSIATGTAEGAVSAAAIAQETGSSSSSTAEVSAAAAAAGSSLFQQQQLLPQKAIVKHLLSNVTDYMDRLKSRALTMMLRGLRSMGYTPDEQWLSRYRKAVAAAAPQMSAWELAIIVSCLVHMGCTVDQNILDLLLSQGPFENFSDGLMADLVAALELLEQQQQQQQQHVVPDRQQNQVAQMQSSWYDSDRQQQQGVSLQEESDVEADRPATLDDLDLRSDQISCDLGSDHALGSDPDVDQVIDAAKSDIETIKSIVYGGSSSDSDSELQHVSLRTVPAAADVTWEDMELEALDKRHRSADHNHLVSDHGSDRRSDNESDRDPDLDLDMLIDSALSKLGSFEAVMNGASSDSEQEDPELAKQITERVEAYNQSLRLIMGE